MIQPVRAILFCLVVLTAGCVSTPAQAPQPPVVAPTADPQPTTLAALMASHGSEGVLVMSGPVLGLVAQRTEGTVEGWVVCWDVRSGRPAQCLSPITLCEFDECFVVEVGTVTDRYRRRR
jgi:hypothetical protein